MMHCCNSAGQNLCIYKESLLMTMDFFRHIPQTIYNAFIHSKSYIDCHHASWVLLMAYYGKNPVEVTLVKSVEDSSERRRPMTTTTRRASEATHYSRGWCCCCMLVVASILSSAQHSLSSLASSSSTK